MFYPTIDTGPPSSDIIITLDCEKVDRLCVQMEQSSSHAMLQLTLTPGLGPTLIRRCLEAMGTAEQILQATAQQLAAIPGISANKAAKFIASWQDQTAVQNELALIEQYGVELLSIADEHYPQSLKWINDPPPLLYVRGKLAQEDALGLAIVGARKCTRYGREMADRFAAGCSQLGLTIISGGAYGIDTASHAATLRVKGRTIAVIGSGLARPYPQPNIQLFDDIVASGGAVISELPMTTSPRPENFPARNRIISGLSLGTLVIEAANRSGALITARLAAEDHGREVMALPGPVDSAMSAGCHRIIREGWASLVTSPAEVLENLGEAGQLLQANAGTEFKEQSVEQPSLFTANLTDSQAMIVEKLEGEMDLNAIARTTGLPMHTIQADLTMLEIRGVVSRQAGKYAKKR